MSDEILRNVFKHEEAQEYVTTATNLSGLDFLLLKASCLDFLGISFEWVGGKFFPFLSNFIMNFFIFFHSLQVSHRSTSLLDGKRDKIDE
jgi:hypothetical protein